jgi:hypothetical protein
LYNHTSLPVSGLDFDWFKADDFWLCNVLRMLVALGAADPASCGSTGTTA